jgi:poly(hydroxyalkanoate) granule-associated protein
VAKTKRTTKKPVKAVAEKKNGKAKDTGLLRRPFLISVGALALAEEQASDMIDSLLDRGEKARKAGEKYMKKEDASKPAKKKPAAKKKSRTGEDLLGRALHWLNIPTRKDIEKLNRKVDSLLKKVA